MTRVSLQLSIALLMIAGVGLYELAAWVGLR